MTVCLSYFADPNGFGRRSRRAKTKQKGGTSNQPLTLYLIMWRGGGQQHSEIGKVKCRHRMWIFSLRKIRLFFLFEIFTQDQAQNFASLETLFPNTGRNRLMIYRFFVYLNFPGYSKSCMEARVCYISDKFKISWSEQTIMLHWPLYMQVLSGCRISFLIGSLDFFFLLRALFVDNIALNPEAQ